jgi:hypothetical protein
MGCYIFTCGFSSKKILIVGKYLLFGSRALAIIKMVESIKAEGTDYYFYLLLIRVKHWINLPGLIG